MVGVQNDSGTSIASIPLSSTSGKALFGFDGDGLCTFLADPGCPFGATGYEGPGASFTNISADLTAGAVSRFYVLYSRGERAPRRKAASA